MLSSVKCLVLSSKCNFSCVNYHVTKIQVSNVMCHVLSFKYQVLSCGKIQVSGVLNHDSVKYIFEQE